MQLAALTQLEAVYIQFHIARVTGVTDAMLPPPTAEQKKGHVYESFEDRLPLSEEFCRGQATVIRTRDEDLIPQNEIHNDRDRKPKWKCPVCFHHWNFYTNLTGYAKHCSYDHPFEKFNPKKVLNALAQAGKDTPNFPETTRRNITQEIR